MPGLKCRARGCDWVDVLVVVVLLEVRTMSGSSMQVEVPLCRKHLDFYTRSESLEHSDPELFLEKP